MEREHTDNKAAAGGTAKNSQMEREKGELAYFLRLFDYLRDILENAPTSFMNRGKGMVDVEECKTLLQDMYNKLPVAVRGASKVYEEQQKILTQAEIDAKRMVMAAENRAQNTLDSANARADTIINSAQEQAERTVANAEAKAEHMIEEARAQAEEMVSETEIMQAAREEARSIVNQALAEASDKRLAAAGFADDILNRLDKVLIEMSDEVRDMKNQLTN